MVRTRIDIVVRTSGAAAASGQIRRIGSTAGVAARGVNVLNAALAAVGVGLGARELVEAADNFTTIRNQIRLVTNSAEEFQAVQRGIISVAQETRAPVESVSTLYRRLALSSEQLGVSQKDIIDFARTFNQAIAVSGATAQEARAGIIQFSQGLASGQLRGEEFRSVLEQLPRVAIALQEGLGITRGELIKLAFAGELTGKQVFEAIAGQGDVINEEFQKVQPTVAQTFQVIQNAATVAIGNLDLVTGASQGFGGSIQEIGQTLDRTFTVGIAKALDGIALLIDGFADVNDILNRLGLGIGDFVGRIEILVNQLLVLINGALTAIQAVRTGLELLDRDERQTPEFAPGSGVQRIRALQPGEARISENEKALNDLRAAANATADATDRLFKSFEDAARNSGQNVEAIEGFASKTREAAEALRAIAAAEAPALSEERGTPAGTIPTDAQRRESETSLRRLIRLQQQLTQETLKRIEPLRAEIQAVDFQIKQVEELKVAAKDEALRQEVINALIEKRTRLEEDLSLIRNEEGTFLTAVQDKLALLTLLDTERAKVLEDQLNTILLQQSGVQRLADLQELLNELTEALEDQAPDIGGTFGPIIGESVGSGISAAIKGESFDIADFLANAVADRMGQLVTETLNKAVEAALNQLSNAAAGEGGFGGAGGLGALVGGAVAIGGIVAAGLRDTETNVRTGLAQSAVTNVQQTRGLIVGPTSVPVAQVGDNIRDSIAPLIEIERQNGQRLTDILDAIRAQRAAGVSESQILNALLQQDAVGSATLE